MNNSEQKTNDIRRPDLHKANVGGSYIVVPQHKEFKFKKACPYCGGDITAQADSWEQQDDGSWMADHFDIQCQTMPDMDNEEEWNEWWANHNDMPYENWLPLVNSVERFIEKKYRFEMER